MITGILLTVIILSTVLLIFSKRDRIFNAYGDVVNHGLLLRYVVVAIVLIVGAFVQPFTFERVDAGHVGIKVKLTGNSRGVSSYEYKTGWVLYNTWVEQMYEFPTFQQHVEYDEELVITKGGFSSKIKPTFNYSLKPNTIGDMFVNLRLDMKQIEQGWLKNAVVGAVNDISNEWKVDKIFNERERFENAIVEECNKRLNKWFKVSQLRTNIAPPKSLQAAIEGKTKAIQEAEAAMQRKLVAEAEAQEKIAIAKGDSAKAVISAAGEAQAVKLRQQQLTPLYIEYLKAKTWDGKLPTTMAGSSTGFILSK